ncbi:MAG: hypothetical protein GOMPHAMPRED_000139 [Gomphillus americanus]|uniref:Uncharacterized protein n=1 Tax=Gomphillus americanus TaxID=1940652 RepID=A0A8H3EA43_9LECA|nr:MAG: hypothetical protein GOMPHAMPRED_000139 [Gomphillus americanus]
MVSIQDGPNPHRPYHNPTSYIPPSIDATVFPGPSTSKSRPAPGLNLSSSAREVISDLDYSDYLSDGSTSVLAIVKRLIDQGLWKYTSILLAQPFEVAKIILQIQDAGYVTDDEPKPHKARSDRSREHQHYYSDEEDDTQSYFTSSAPSMRTHREYHPKRRYSSSGSLSRGSTPPRSSRASAQQDSHTKALPSTSSLTVVLSSLWSTEGAWGVWKGTNSTFWHSVLLSTIGSFLRSFFCAVFALPDPTIAITALPSPSSLARLDILSSPSPLTSLALSVCATGIAGLILSPLDVARIKLIASPSTHTPRSILSTISSIGSWSSPISIAHITLLHSTLPTLLTASTPFFLRSQLGLDPATTPTTYAALTFLSQATELSIRLPIETALRRAQLQIARTPISKSTTHHNNSPLSDFQTTIPIGPYKGLWGTWYHIANEEGSRPSQALVSSRTESRSSTRSSTTAADVRRRKGQGIEGLYRGWRVGAWGLLGIWTAHLAGGGSSTGSSSGLGMGYGSGGGSGF